MKKEKKIINHKFLDKHTILGAIFLTILALLIAQAVIGGILGLIIGIIIGIIHPVGSNIPITMGVIIASFIMLAIHKRWFYPEFKGNLSTPENLRKWLLFVVVVVVLIIIPDFSVMLATHGNMGIPSFASILLAIMAGTSEEVIFRAVPGSYMMRQFKDEKKVPIVILLTSLIFGLFHMTNLFVGAAFSSTIFQVITAFTAGIVLCTIYLRSGSILPSMLYHTLNDLYAFTNLDVVNNGVMDTALGTRDIVINIVISVVELAVAYYLLRGDGKKNISKIWADKWNYEEE